MEQQRDAHAGMGGSYQVDPVTGLRTLVERAGQPAPTSAPTNEPAPAPASTPEPAPAPAAAVKPANTKGARNA